MKKVYGLFCVLSATVCLLLPCMGQSMFGADGLVKSADATENPMLNRLQLKEKRLNAELKSLDKNDPDFLILSQSILDELAGVRRQMQNIAAAPKNPVFSELGSMAPDEKTLAAQKAVLSQDNLTAPGTVSAPGPVSSSGLAPTQGAQLPVGPISLFEQIKEELNLQLKQLRQMQQSIRPQDGRLATLLQGQEKDILNQLRELDRQIAEMNVSQGSIPVGTSSVETPQSRQADMSQMPVVSPLESKQQGRPAISYTVTPVPDGGDGSTTVETPGKTIVSVPPKSTYSWAPAAGNDPALSSVRDPFAPAPSPELLEIKRMVTELKEDITKLQAELTAINTQLRLLSFRIAGSESISTPVGQPADTVRKSGDSGRPADKK